jgi:hypothetical protein
VGTIEGDDEKATHKKPERSDHEIVEEANGIPSSRFGAHKRSKLKLTQKEHEETTRDVH